MKKNFYESKLNYQNLFNSLNDAAVLVNAENGLIVDVNVQANHLFGKSKNTLLSINYKNLFSPECWREYEKIIVAKKGEIKKIELEGEIVRYDGTLVMVRINVLDLMMAAGRYYLFLMQDITEKKWARMALALSENKYRQLIENLKEGIVKIDQNAIITFINLALAKMLGYTQGELTGKIIFSFIRKIDYPIVERYLEKRKEEIREQQEIALVRKDGRLIYVSITATPIFDYSKVYLGMIAGVIDLTRQKQSEKKVARYQERLRSLVNELLITEERERARLAMALHDNITQNLAISKIKLSESLDLSKQTDIKTNLRSIAKIIEETLRYIRFYIFNLSPPVLHEIGLEAALDTLIEKLQEQYHLVIEMRNNCLPTEIDPRINILLFEVVRELLMNVVKHAQASHVSIDLGKQKNRIYVSVADNGKGFDPLKNSLVFYKEAHFGLFSVRERLHYVRGSFTINSKIGVGTRICVTAPIKLPQQRRNGFYAHKNHHS